MSISSKIPYEAPDLELSVVAPQGIIAASVDVLSVVDELSEYTVEEETW